MSDNGNGMTGGGFGGGAQGGEMAAQATPGPGGNPGGSGYGQWGQPMAVGTPGLLAQGQMGGAMPAQGADAGAGQAQQQAPATQTQPGFGAPQGQWQAAPPVYPGQVPAYGWPHPGAMAQVGGGMGPSPLGNPGWVQGASWPPAEPGYPQQTATAYAPGSRGPAQGAQAGAALGMGARTHGAGMSQLMQEVAGGGSGLSSLTQMLNLDDKELWKGALIGAAVVLLLTNESVQNALFKTGVRARDAVKSGVEKVKASAANVGAEASRAAKPAAGGGDE